MTTGPELTKARAELQRALDDFLAHVLRYAPQELSTPCGVAVLTLLRELKTQKDSTDAPE